MRVFSSPAVRIAFALISVTLALLLSAYALRIMPDAQNESLAYRKRTVETLTVQLSSPTMLGEVDAMLEVLNAVVSRSSDVLSAGLRDAEGQLLLESGDHLLHWQPQVDGRSTPEFVSAPIYAQDELLGAVEVRFKPLPSMWTLSLGRGSFASLLLFIAVSGALGYFVVLRRSLKALDPSAVIPERVRMVMDSLAEGVIVMDHAANILLANRAFATELSVPVAQLVGKSASLLNWRAAETGGSPLELPWAKAMRTCVPELGHSLALRTADGSMRSFAVNCTPIMDSRGKVTGAFASFNDVTQLQQQNGELQTTLAELQAAQESVQLRNAELSYLATRDPLTGCLNRRALFAAFDKAFSGSGDGTASLCCAMIDIDHFKQVNDQFGHSTGDRVIAYVAETIRLTVGETDLVGRYGGEEYCVVFPGRSAAEAMVILERIREAVIQGAVSRFTNNLKLTVSGGLAQQAAGDMIAGALIERADVALYTAKHSGRNRVLLWTEDMKHGSNAAPAPRTDKVEISGVWKNHAAGVFLATGVHRLSQLTAHDEFRGRVEQLLALAARHSWTSALVRIEFETASLKVPRAAAEVLERVASLLRSSDTVALMHGSLVETGGTDAIPNVSPLSATELGVLMPDIADLNAVGRVVQRIIHTVAEPVVIDGNESFTTCSIGICIAPVDGEDFDTLMQRAAQAQRTVRVGRSSERYAFYQQSMTDTLLRAMRIESGLRRALDRDEFQLVYQPQVNMTTNVVTGFEALLRWTRPDEKSIGPDEFIPIAEASGLIGPIGDWVLHNACLQARSWQMVSDIPRRVAVNISAVQIMSADFAARVTTILKSTQVDPRLIELEITETAFMSDLVKASETLRDLRKLGLHIALDDFGTGYSSLSYLKQLPIDCVKIDSRFVRDLNNTREGVALVTAIIGMAHGLGIRVVAEGIETMPVFELLQSIGCDQAQGYLISRPVSAEEAANFAQMEHAAVTKVAKIFPDEGRVAARLRQ
jgi:diguanylate cyclase (GGDEF)-like protein/PAS domain S-box-containing protein